MNRGAPVLPFPSSPPTVTPPVSPAPASAPCSAPRPAKQLLPPISDCPQCTRELFPRKHCTCGTAKQRESAWKAADDLWFRAQLKAWFAYYAPPRRTDSVQVLADLDAMWDELGKLREAQAVEAQAAKAEGAGSMKALHKGRMTAALKIWLNPALVDVKRMAAGRPPGYISFYDRKIAQFKARDKRRALLKLQREAPPKRPLRRGYRHPPVNFTRAAGSGKDLGKNADAEGRAEADLKEEHRLQRLRVAYLL
ncbi:hypothetical protein DFH09DRAFT_1326317 [Mycena vulgaris]|nr:hypothetical protein DFH09DRAFT_1326317 [Mycena vulgaris]